MMAPTLDKAELRRHLRRQRQNLTASARRTATHRISRYLYPLIRRGKRIGVYWAVGSELALDDFIATARKRGARLYLPYITPNRRRLWFTPLPAKPHPANAHPFSIPQFAGNKIRVHLLHVLLVPLVGIDARGVRLGQGGGYYDTTLAHTRHRLHPRVIGVGFACQQIPRLVAQAHDQPLPAFVCEHGWQHFKNIDN